jgi:hypothetical protein
MLKIICFLGLIAVSINGISQKARYFKFMDAETGEILSDIDLTAINSSKVIITHGEEVTSLKKHKKKNQYYLSADNYQTRGIGPSEIPKKKDTAILLVVPSIDLMDDRWDEFIADSASNGAENDVITLKNTMVLEKLVANRLMISKAAMIHCESLNASRPTFHFLVEFAVDEIGMLHFRDVEYMKDSPECLYIFRELKRTVMGMSNVRIEDAIEGRKEGRQRLLLPISVGL